MARGKEKAGDKGKSKLWSLLLGEESDQKEDYVVLNGVVAVLRDQAGEVVAVTLTSDCAKYNVVLSNVGRELGQEMDGKRVEVTGVVRAEGGRQSLWVDAYRSSSDDDEGQGSWVDELDSGWEEDIGESSFPPCWCV